MPPPNLPKPNAPPPPHPQALTKWGGALLELAHFRQGAEAYEMIEEAIGKFEQALALDAARHDALWCLGNAFTSQGFLSAEAASGGGRGSACVGTGPRADSQALRSKAEVNKHGSQLRLQAYVGMPCHPRVLCMSLSFCTACSAAGRYFDKAGECFRKAVDLEPANDTYRRALEMSSKAPQVRPRCPRLSAALL